MALLKGLTSARVTTLDEVEVRGLADEFAQRARVEDRRRDEGEEDLASLAASEYAKRFDPVQEVRASRPPAPSWATGNEVNDARSGRAIVSGLEQAFKQRKMVDAARQAIGLVLPEKADLLHWRGATDLQRANALVAIERMLDGNEGGSDALGHGFIQGTKATLGPSLILAADRTQRMAKAAIDASNVLLGIETRADNNLIRRGLGFENFDPRTEPQKAKQYEARKEGWLQDQLVPVQAAMVSAGFVMPGAALEGPLKDRIRATTDLAAGFFASLQGPGSANVPSAQDVFTGIRAKEAAELADPRVAPGFVLGPDVKASFDRFMGYYNEGNTDAIRAAVTRGQGAIRTLADSLGVEPRQADAMVASAEHTATGLFSGPDARRLALYADSQRSMVVHEVDEFATWKVGGPEAVRYAGLIQNSALAAAGGGLHEVDFHEIERNLADAFKEIPPHEAGALYLGGFHPAMILAALMATPKPVVAREYLKAASELPEEPGYGKPWDRRAGVIVDPDKKRLIQFGVNDDVRVFGFSSGVPERIYQGNVAAAPLDESLKRAHRDSKDALNRDQVMLVEAVTHGLINLDYCLERNINIHQIRPDAALALDGIPENEDVIDLGAADLHGTFESLPSDLHGRIELADS
jgi:hypothetical protein